jgi:hypothetical protein
MQRSCVGEPTQEQPRGETLVPAAFIFMNDMLPQRDTARQVQSSRRNERGSEAAALNS